MHNHCIDIVGCWSDVYSTYGVCSDRIDSAFDDGDGGLDHDAECIAAGGLGRAHQHLDLVDRLGLSLVRRAGRSHRFNPAIQHAPAQCGATHILWVVHPTGCALHHARHRHIWPASDWPQHPLDCMAAPPQRVRHVQPLLLDSVHHHVFYIFVLVRAQHHSKQIHFLHVLWVHFRSDFIHALVRSKHWQRLWIQRKHVAQWILWSHDL